jgi:alpha-glucosidase
MKILKLLSINLRLIKLQRFLGSLTYPLQRDRLERRFRNSKTLKASEKAGNIIRVEQTSKGGHFYFKDLELEVSFLRDDFVRVDWKPSVPPIPYAIARNDWSTVEITFQQQDDCWVVSSAVLKVNVKADGSLKFQDANGITLREELPPKRQVRVSPRFKNEGWVHQAKLRPDEHIYGLGERAAPFNLRSDPNRSYRMWNSDWPGIYGSGDDPLYLCIPVYMSLYQGGSYLIFYENSYPATFSFKDVATVDLEGGSLRYYLTFGSPDRLLERYTELTGRPPLPPHWALGYHQSRWGYETEEEVRKTAVGFKTHNLPLNAIHLDIDCQENFRAFSIDPNRFPKLTEFSKELAEWGVRLIAINSPGIKADRKNKLFEEGRAQDIFCKYPNGKPVLAPVWSGWCAFPDFTNPQARHWWSRQYEYLLDLGITGFWHDMNEPAVLVLWGDRTLPAYDTLHFMEGRGGNHREAHNIYGFLQAKAGYESLREYRPEQRPFIVARAGWAGLQRYAWTWTGDIVTSWKGLRQTIPTVLGMGLSGIPYTGPDIGGFKGDPSSELYLRWFQMACFLTFCRTHCADNAKPRTPWSYGEEALNIIREFLHLRYRLLPYFYTLAWEATLTGHSPVRPLFWIERNNQNLWNVEDAFLLGNALLVYPIVEKGATSRKVTLPQGYWYNFWNDSLIEGANQIEMAAPLEKIPLLVKAGSILPMEVEEKLILHLYPPEEGNCQGQVYTDAGDGYGNWRVDEFHLSRDDKSLELTWQQQGEYPFPYKEVQLHLHGFELQEAWIDGKSVSSQENRLDVDRFKHVRLQGKFQEVQNSQVDL